MKKNIFLLPVSKSGSSKLLYNNRYNSFCFQNEPGSMYVNDGKVNGADFWGIEKASNNGFLPHYIYITSDEEIKDHAWYYTTRFNIGIAKNEGDSKIERTTNSYKKIILTTDTDLIADGVQAIDDKFLEWFVKNPSCEFVETELLDVSEVLWEEYFKKHGVYPKYPYYEKVIIPQEERKQETVKVPCSLCDGTGETVFSGTYTTQRKCDLCNGEKYWDKKVLVESPHESKQETLKAATYILQNSTYGAMGKDIEEGVKCQAERMYSEEEVLQLLNDIRGENPIDVDNWFEQNKKK